MLVNPSAGFSTRYIRDAIIITITEANKKKMLIFLKLLVSAEVRNLRSVRKWLRRNMRKIRKSLNDLNTSNVCMPGINKER